MDIVKRFNEKWTPEPFSGCWLWIGGVRDDGYGQFIVSRKVLRAHRVSYLIHVGAIPNGNCVLHRCDTPLCVNPAHLFLGTVADNNRDRAIKCRSAGKLSKDQALVIRNLKLSGQALAREFGISAAQVSRIKNTKKWKHL